jgi:hypothetical protein
VLRQAEGTLRFHDEIVNSLCGQSDPTQHIVDENV